MRDNRQRLLLAGLLCVMMLFTMACKSLPGKEAASANSGYTVVDEQGTEVSFAVKPARILTLSMSTDEVVLGLVEPEKMAAVNALLDDPVSSNVTELVKNIPQRVQDPSVEEIVSLKPDLVIMPDWGDVSKAQNLRDLGIPVVVCKGAKNLEEIKSSIQVIAAAVGEPERGQILCQKMDDKLAAIHTLTQEIPESERKSVVLLSLMKSYGGIGCSFDEACQYAGVRNGMAELGIHTGQVMTKEQLLKINPDYLFLPTYTNNGKYDASEFRDSYLKDPALRNLKAIRNQGLREPNESYIYNCSQDFVFGVQEIAYQVYGDKFKQPAGQHLSALE